MTLHPTGAIRNVFAKKIPRSLERGIIFLTNAPRFFEETFFDETLVNEAADKPAANSRQQTLPTVMIQAPRAERKEKYKQKTRPADFVENFLEKFFHVNHLRKAISNA